MGKKAVSFVSDVLAAHAPVIRRDERPANDYV